jgi:hypothetical protein
MILSPRFERPWPNVAAPPPGRLRFWSPKINELMTGLAFLARFRPARHSLAT